MQKLETSLEYYKSKYEEFLKLFAKKTELEKIIHDLKVQLEESLFLNSSQATKISKHKDLILSLKAKNIDIELEISKKNTENDLLNLQKLDLHKRIEKLEVSLMEKNEEIQEKTEKPAFSNDLRSDLCEYLNANGQLNFFDKNKRESIEFSKNLQNLKNDEEEMEILHKENALLLEKCKSLSNENEGNRGLLGKMEKTVSNIQKEKEELLAQIKYFMNKESDLQTNVENNVKFWFFEEKVVF